MKSASIQKEEKKDDGRADQLHILNEEFAQAIIFKKNELMLNDERF